jgi:hypothetical protein
MICLLRAALLLLAFLSAPLAAQEDEQQSILFIGNSFTQGANSAVLRYRPDSVTDLNGEGVGGIPALFAKFAEQAGLNWTVSHELRGGTTLGFHLREKRQLIDGAWDVVVMQQYSVLNPDRPGDAGDTRKYAPALARMFEAANRAVRIYLMSTWSRADQVYRPEGHWHGKPVGQMAVDLRRLLDLVDREADEIDGVIPVGEAWNRAMLDGVADPDPYDGREYGKIDLWSYDHYHASAEGSYLEALVVFARITGHDVREFGASERAAHELGIEPKMAVSLQQIAMKQVESEAARGST